MVGTGKSSDLVQLSYLYQRTFFSLVEEFNGQLQDRIER